MRNHLIQNILFGVLVATWNPGCFFPPNVTNLSATAGDTQVLLTWEEPDDSNFVSIEVTWIPGGTKPRQVAKGARTYNATGLTSNTDYLFTVRAVYQWSLFSTGATVLVRTLENQKEEFPFHSFYQEFRESVWNFPYDENTGTWASTNGDQAYYGLAFYLNVGKLEKLDNYLTRAYQRKNRNIELVKEANIALADALKNFDLTKLMALLNNFEETLMSELGLIEYLAVADASTDKNEILVEVDKFLDYINTLDAYFGYYLDFPNNPTLNIYGSTAISGVIAIMNLRYVQLLTSSRNPALIDIAQHIIETIDAKVYIDNNYLFNPSFKGIVSLLPNAIMILANSFAYQVTKDENYRQRCLDVYQGIQVLKDPETKGYLDMGSPTLPPVGSSKVFSLSSENYTLIGMTMLYLITKDDKYKKEILDIVSFTHDKLYVNGELRHDLAEDRVSDYYCAGCNLQFLYAIWYIEHFIYGY